MYKVYEATTGKRRYIGGSFNLANQIKEALERKGVPSVWVFIP